MATIPARPLGATSTGPHSPAPARDAVNWDDPEDVRLWLAALRSAADDAVAAGHDATLPPADRVLARPEARRRLTLADASIATLLDAGERGLDRGATH